jgi:hypothetical protein
MRQQLAGLFCDFFVHAAQSEEPQIKGAIHPGIRHSTIQPKEDTKHGKS